MTQRPPLAHEWYLVYAIVTATLFVVGFTGQVLSFLVLLKKDHRQREMTPYLVNIAIANTSLLGINFPVIFASSLARGWVLNRVGCVILGFNAGLTGVVMIVTLTCLTVNIYKQIVKQSANNRLNNALPRNSSWLKVIAGVWVYSALTMVPTLFGLGSVALEAGNTHCAPDWRSNLPEDVVYLVFLTTAAFLVPVTITSASLKKMHRFLATSQRANKTLSSQQRHHYEQYKGAARMISLATLMFFLAWTPYCLCSLITLFSNPDIFTGAVSIIPALLAKSSVIYNPILYTMLNRRFRHSLVTLLPEGLRKMSARSKVQPQGETLDRSSNAEPEPRPGYDRRQSKSNKLVPRSPLTGRSKSSPNIMSLVPVPSPQSRPGGRYKPSIHFLLRPSFLALRMLRSQLSDEGSTTSVSNEGPNISEELEEKNHKESRIKTQASF